MRRTHEPPRLFKEQRRRRRRRGTSPSAATPCGLRPGRTWGLRASGRWLLTSHLIREPCTCNQAEQNNHNPTKHNVSLEN